MIFRKMYKLIVIIIFKRDYLNLVYPRRSICDLPETFFFFIKTKKSFTAQVLKIDYFQLIFLFMLQTLLSD